MTIRAWLARRKEKRNAERFRAGYLWARSLTLAQIEARPSNARRYTGNLREHTAQLRAGYPRVVMCGSTGIKAIVDSPEEEDDFHGCLVRPLAWIFLGALCMFIGGFLYWVIP